MPILYSLKSLISCLGLQTEDIPTVTEQCDHAGELYEPNQAYTFFSLFSQFPARICESSKETDHLSLMSALALTEMPGSNKVKAGFVSASGSCLDLGGNRTHHLPAATKLGADPGHTACITGARASL